MPRALQADLLLHDAAVGPARGASAQRPEAGRARRAVAAGLQRRVCVGRAERAGRRGGGRGEAARGAGEAGRLLHVRLVVSRDARRAGGRAAGQAPDQAPLAGRAGADAQATQARAHRLRARSQRASTARARPLAGHVGVQRAGVAISVDGIVTSRTHVAKALDRVAGLGARRAGVALGRAGQRNCAVLALRARDSTDRRRVGARVALQAGGKARLRGVGPHRAGLAGRYARVRGGTWIAESAGRGAGDAIAASAAELAPRVDDAVRDGPRGAEAAVRQAAGSKAIRAESAVEAGCPAVRARLRPGARGALAQGAGDAGGAVDAGRVGAEGTRDAGLRAGARVGAQAAVDAGAGPRGVLVRPSRTRAALAEFGAGGVGAGRAGQAGRASRGEEPRGANRTRGRTVLGAHCSRGTELAEVGQRDGYPGEELTGSAGRAERGRGLLLIRSAGTGEAARRIAK
mmetsp:Transcript_9454/g.27142  ORF Transcript_9454/g.27142 Transcript_9454/m.27142 type:complete len:460 (+) Transcript_9454:4269-5648(+)